MHVTAIEPAEGDLHNTRVTATATIAAFHRSRARLQHSQRRAWLLGLASAVFSLTASACTPVGEVNKQSALERAGSSAEPDEHEPTSDDDAIGGNGAPSNQSGRAGASAGAGGRERGGAGTDSKSDAQTSAGRAAVGGNNADAGRGGAGRASAAAAGSSNETGMGGKAGSPGTSPHAGGAGADSSSTASGGTGAAGSAAPSGWLCTPVGPSCTCVESPGASGDDCPRPKPTCCFTLVRFGANACTCWPEDSEECKTQTTEVPDAKPAAQCPP